MDSRIKTAAIAFELMAQGIWDQTDFMQFCSSVFQNAYRIGYKESQSDMNGNPLTDIGPGKAGGMY